MGEVERKARKLAVELQRLAANTDRTPRQRRQARQMAQLMETFADMAEEQNI